MSHGSPIDPAYFLPPCRTHRVVCIDDGCVGSRAQDVTDGPCPECVQEAHAREAHAVMLAQARPAHEAAQAVRATALDAVLTRLDITLSDVRAVRWVDNAVYSVDVRGRGHICVYRACVAQV